MSDTVKRTSTVDEIEEILNVSQNAILLAVETIPIDLAERLPRHLTEGEVGQIREALDIHNSTISTIKPKVIKIADDVSEYFVVDREHQSFSDVPESWQVDHEVVMYREGDGIKLRNISLSPHEEIWVHFGIKE